MFEERLGSYWCDIFAIMAVLAVAVARTSMASQWKSSYFGLYLVQNRLLK